MRMILKKNILNVFMLISFLLIINYHFTGNIVHEILGLVILLFSLVHMNHVGLSGQVKWRGSPNFVH